MREFIRSQEGSQDYNIINIIKKFYNVFYKIKVKGDSNLIYVITDNEVSVEEAIRLANELKSNGYSVDYGTGTWTMNVQFRDAIQKNSRIILVLSKDNLVKEIITFNDIFSDRQKNVTKDQLITEIKEVMEKRDRKWWNKIFNLNWSLGEKEMERTI